MCYRHFCSLVTLKSSFNLEIINRLFFLYDMAYTSLQQIFYFTPRTYYLLPASAIIIEILS